MSCSDPGVQQLPRGEHRKAVVAPPGRVLVKADYSQLQLRILAAAANDRAMLAAYERGEDLHALTALRMTGREEVTKEERQQAKIVNFGVIYGMGAAGLVKVARRDYGIEMSVAEARAFQDAFFRAWPGVDRWFKRLMLDARYPNGPREVRSPSGRRVLIPDHDWHGKRANYSIVTRESDGFKAVLALLWQRRGQCPGAIPVAFVHDEVVLEWPSDQADAAAAYLVAAMRDGMTPAVAPCPLVVEATAGPSWGEQYPVAEWMARAKRPCLRQPVAPATD
jgi:DNA polymerase-1